ncbi:hypothetical protein BAZ12_14115 [Elizabethkingia miricola]|nr:hypothetical protein BAZ12_14115 [Elizabethkingia miricola]OPC74958.1 hypothetical protein BAZ13_18950 [Elizabethkingia miricola]
MCLEINLHIEFLLHKFPTLGLPIYFFFANARKSEILFSVEFAGIQKMPMCLTAFFWHFSMLALTTLIICSFALMQKNQKIKL